MLEHIKFLRELAQELRAENKQLKQELEELKIGKRTRPPHLKVISINRKKAVDSLRYNNL